MDSEGGGEGCAYRTLLTTFLRWTGSLVRCEKGILERLYQAVLWGKGLYMVVQWLYMYMVVHVLKGPL